MVVGNLKIEWKNCLTNVGPRQVPQMNIKNALWGIKSVVLGRDFFHDADGKIRAVIRRMCPQIRTFDERRVSTGVCPCRKCGRLM